MDATFINPFIKSTLNVLNTMCMTEALSGKPYLKKDNLTHGVVTGLIGLTSSSLHGNIILTFDEPSIIGIVSRMLGEEIKEINHDVVDAVGELTNMITGGVKKDFNEMGHVIDMAIPAVIVGKNIEITQLTKAPMIALPFKTKEGEFVVESNLSKTS